MSNIVPLRKNKAVIELLERYLDLARKNLLHVVGLVSVETDPESGQTLTQTDFTFDEDYFTSLVYGAVELQHSLMRVMDIKDETA